MPHRKVRIGWCCAGRCRNESNGDDPNGEELESNGDEPNGEKPNGEELNANGEGPYGEEIKDKAPNGG